MNRSRTRRRRRDRQRRPKTKRYRALWTVGAVFAVVLVGFLWIAGGSGPGGTGKGLSERELLALESQGKTIYELSCANCHGLKGEGQPNWRQQNPDGTFPAPPHDATGHTWHHPDGLLYRVVLAGGRDSPGFKASMPAYRDVLTSEEVRAVLTYIKTFWRPRERATQAQRSLPDPFP